MNTKPQKYGMVISSQGWNNISASRPAVRSSMRVLTVRVTLYQKRRKEHRTITVTRLPLGRRMGYDVSVFFDSSKTPTMTTSVRTLNDAERKVRYHLNFFSRLVPVSRFMSEVLT